MGDRIPLVLMLATAAVFVADELVCAAEPDLWTVSMSPTDPFATTAIAANGNRTLYLWIALTPASPILAADLVLASEGNLSIGPLVPSPGTYLSRGVYGDGHYLIDFGAEGCRSGPFLVASFPASDHGGRVCFDTFESIWPCAESCKPWEQTLGGSEGFSSAGAPCILGRGDRYECNPYPAVEPNTWGRTKANYRR